jgi:hypothetical protein
VIPTRHALTHVLMPANLHSDSTEY